jgi:hypothetical protein
LFNLFALLRDNVLIIFVVHIQGGIIDENEEVITRRLNTVVQRLSCRSSVLPSTGLRINVISASLPDPQKAADDLNSFAKANEGRLYKLFKTCIDAQTDLKGLVKATVSIFGLSSFVPPICILASFDSHTFYRMKFCDASSSRRLQFYLR